MMTDDSILSDDFLVSVGDKCLREYHVTLSDTCILLKPTDFMSGKFVEISGRRIVSCRETTSTDKDEEDVEKESPSQKSLFSLHYLPSESSLTLKKFTFLRSVTGLRDEEQQLGGKWTELIRSTFKLQTRHSDNRKLLVLINPFSGKGHALSVFRKLEPILKEAEIEFEAVKTSDRGHARELLKTEKDIRRFRGILVLSGDGVVHEALNGIYQRSSSDWKDILQTVSLGVIPVGSGNGLARNVRFHLGERTRGDGTAQAVLNAVRGRSTPIDLFHLEHRGSDSRVDEDSSHMLGFLSLGWGIIADIDIESERLRSLGELRFAIYAIKKIQERRLLKARLSYLKTDTDMVDAILLRMNQRYEEKKEQVEDAIPSDLKTDLPTAWTTEIDDFIGVYALNLPFIDSTSKVAPESRLNDGHLWLMILRRNATKTDLLKVFLSVESGKHVSVRGVDMVKVQAFRLEPLQQGSHVTIDGEVLDYGPVQARILEGAGRVMIKR